MNPGSYIMLASGTCVGESGAPTIEDVVLGLSRAPRFGGHSRVPWTVLEHSLFVHRLAQAPVEQSAPSARVAAIVRLAALLHDAHECVTGDIPTPFKSASMKMFQRMLDRRIATALVPECPTLFHEFPAEVKLLDAVALPAEALVVGPETLQTPELVKEHFGTLPNENAVALLHDERKLARPEFRFLALYKDLRLELQKDGA